MKDILLTALGILLVALVLFANMIAMGFIASKIMWKKVLSRENGKGGKWSRMCSEKGNPEQEKIWDEGLRFYQDHQDIHTEFSLVSDGIKLVGDYFDFGGDTTVIIIPGRNETGIYSLHFADPYAAIGYNVLVFDPRAHGLSEGEDSGCGILEANDLLAMANYAHDVLKSKYVVFHGICIGGGSACLLMGGPKAPSFVKGITLDGIFVSFYEQFKRRMIDGCHPTWPTMMCFRIYAKKKLGADILKESPKKYLPSVRCPALFLQGVKDRYSLPEKTKQLFTSCGASKKEIVWFEKGGHSHIKVNNPEQYREAIASFYQSL